MHDADNAKYVELYEPCNEYKKHEQEMWNFDLIREASGSVGIY